MAENDDAVLTAAVGYAFVAEPGTKHPTAAELKTIDLEDPSSWGITGGTWISVGHTSRGTLPEFGFDGDDSEVKGSWQKKKLREITTEDPIDYLTILLHQFDEQSLGLYYGPNASTVPGEFGVKTGQTNEKAVLVVIVDGDMRLGHYVEKSSVKRDAAIDMPIDDLAALPVRFTYLDPDVGDIPFKWINEDLFNVDAGTEG
ncbi:major tail protein [Mycobacterium phage Blinn1]|uniref:Major tail protein n=5 Tax=Caudoviricetes TaxID=2731619 RepID=A0A6G8R1A9_9CAUD|nr:major tail protein [Mycobacterium phage Blinn1]YP_010061159.1 major tail protein [Mycobacterium phage JewelBug]AOT24765.1 major tail protein [Mycobacterium phage Isiphiwo]AVP42149.1 major tail protein [Mycobacterium phage SuperAwesome]QIN93748.1 major tail protein [Mycobacterium phage Pmask]QXN73117.1 major tail protein [Mycobacterium Phage Cookiedough]UAJ16355.1 major tail protein [Mycobacterium phage Newrala]UYL86949.1 major tail protein [Mycobacterium phage BABullseye]